MAGLTPFTPKIGTPGLGLPTPRALPEGNRQAFGELFDSMEREFPGLQAPSSSLATPFEPDVAVGSTQAIQGLGRPLHEFLDSVNTLSLHSDGLKEELATGGDVELHEVMIAAEKASVAVNLTMQLRNKLVDAYQEVMRMSV